MQNLQINFRTICLSLFSIILCSFVYLRIQSILHGISHLRSQGVVFVAVHMVDSIESTTDPIALADPQTASLYEEPAPVNVDLDKSRLVQSFPRYKINKLDESNYIQCQRHVQLIINGYELTGYLDGALKSPQRFVQNLDGKLVLNPQYSLFKKQDKLLAAWILSMISRPLLSCFIGVKIANDIQSTTNKLFAIVIGVKISKIKHNLHIIKKGNLSIKEYIYIRLGILVH